MISNLTPGLAKELENVNLGIFLKTTTINHEKQLLFKSSDVFLEYEENANVNCLFHYSRDVKMSKAREMVTRLIPLFDTDSSQGGTLSQLPVIEFLSWVQI
jgi:hypothetical protein